MTFGSKMSRHVICNNAPLSENCSQQYSHALTSHKMCDFYFEGVCQSTSPCIFHNYHSFMINPSLNGKLNRLYEYTNHVCQIRI